MTNDELLEKLQRTEIEIVDEESLSESLGWKYVCEINADKDLYAVSVSCVYGEEIKDIPADLVIVNTVTREIDKQLTIAYREAEQVLSTLQVYSGYYSSRSDDIFAINAKNYRAASYQAIEAFNDLMTELSDFGFSRCGRSAGYVGIDEFQNRKVNCYGNTLEAKLHTLSEIDDLKAFCEGLRTLHDRVREFKQLTTPQMPAGKYIEFRLQDNGNIKLVLKPAAIEEFTTEEKPTLAELLEDISSNSDYGFGTADQFGHMSEAPCIYSRLAEDQAEPTDLWYFDDYLVVNEIAWLWKYGELTFFKLY
ncbi:hypothetical protein [Chroococcidiopsis sp.]|uniref:hypothetical protein n=1 Tax=Chroococcidiopsis sp. TaxID=3088168 RepID=UPI003F2CC630